MQLHRDDLMATSLEDLMVHLRDLRDERKNVLLITGGWVPRPPASGLSNRGRGTIPRIGTDPGGRLGIGVPQAGASNDAWCDQQIGRLANIDFEQRFRDLLTLARNANVSFYPVDVGGLRVNLPDASTPGLPSAGRVFTGLNAGAGRVDTLKTLAENTDGLAVVDNNDLGAGFRRISDDLSAYYLLGYSSTNTNIDGKYRRIEVKVNQPKVSVTARRGYLAPSAATRAATASKAAATAVPATVAEELARLARLRLDNELLTYGVRSATGLDIVTEISAQEMARGRWSAGADARAVFHATAGDITATGRIEPGSRGTVLHLVLPDPATGPWVVGVRVSHDAVSLEDRAEIPVPAQSSLVGSPIAFRGTASSRIPLRPVADFQFHRTERLRVEWPILKALDQRTARLLDRKGLPLPLNATVTEIARREDSEAVPAAGAGTGPRVNEETAAGAPKNVAVDLNLAPLAEGDYLIELAAGAGGQVERRLLAFRVIR
jgi:hypothetical protein